MVHPTFLVGAATFTIMFAAFFAAILGAIYRSRENRAFWIGFGLFGWGYLSLVYVPWLVGISSLGNSLFGSAMSESVYPWVRRVVPLLPREETQFGWQAASEGGQKVRVLYSEGHVWLICTSLVALLLALVGGLLGRYFAATRENTPDVPRTGSPS